MNYKFIDYPRFIPLSKYDLALEKMVKKLEKRPEIKSIYQIGSISTPGISDIDLVAVFKNGKQCNFDPRSNITDDEKYLFVHKLFGISESDFRESHRFTIFHNYKCLSGEELIPSEHSENNAELTALRTQLALEYLLKFYFNAFVESTYGIIKLRTLFLHVRALNYDLEFLQAPNSLLKESVDTLIEFRKNWFNKSITIQTILKVRSTLFYHLDLFLQNTLSRVRFYTLDNPPIHLSKNMVLGNGIKLACFHKGIVLPHFSTFINRRYFNLNHRLNSFEFSVPITIATQNSFHMQRFDYLHQLAKSQQTNFPHFMALNPGLGAA
ncbi:hypothetical protein KC799_17930 [candidate division KSB1 bacterium]|nr:hypothetical protein [candidate division KSB1 bacterium]